MNARADLKYLARTCNFTGARGPFPPPRFLPSIFIAQSCSAIPLLVDFSSSVANSHSRAFRKSICAQEKVPTNLYEHALELTKLTYTRLEDNLIRHRGDRGCTHYIFMLRCYFPGLFTDHIIFRRWDRVSVTRPAPSRPDPRYLKISCPDPTRLE